MRDASEFNRRNFVNVSYLIEAMLSPKPEHATGHAGLDSHSPALPLTLERECINCGHEELFHLRTLGKQPCEYIVQEMFSRPHGCGCTNFQSKELARPQKPAPSPAGSDARNSGIAEGREAKASAGSDSGHWRRPSAVSSCPDCGHATKFHLTPDGMPMACDYLPMDCYTLCGCQHELKSYDHVEGDR